MGGGIEQVTLNSRAYLYLVCGAHRIHGLFVLALVLEKYFDFRIIPTYFKLVLLFTKRIPAPALWSLLRRIILAWDEGALRALGPYPEAGTWESVLGPERRT